MTLALWMLAACGPSDAQVAAFVGDWHIDGDARGRIPDAVTLTLRDDHTFTWVIDGCDFGGGDGGTWSVVNGRARLRPAEGDTLSWLHDAGDVAEIVATVAGGHLTVTVTHLDPASPPFGQRWDRGADFIDCSGGTL